MGDAKRDSNYIPTLLGVSNADGTTPVTLYADPTTHRLLVSMSATLDDLTDVVITSGAQGDVLYFNGSNWVNLAAGSNGQFLKTQGVGANPTWAAGGSGTVTTVSVVTANGISGVVANASTTPAITITLGAITPTTVNGLTITSSTGTITVTNGKTLSVAKTLNLDGTDSTTMTFPSTSATIARTDAGQTFTGTQIMTSPKILTSILDTNGNEVIDLIATGSAVNEIEITNTATGTLGPLIKAAGETNLDLRLSAKGTGAIHHITGAYGDITAYAPGGGGTATLTLNTANIHTITMPAGNITIALSNEHVGQCFMINIIQDSSGSRTVTWFTTIKWAGGSSPTLTTTANKIDCLGFMVASAGNYYGYVIGQNL